MDANLQSQFLNGWRTYFPGAPLPLAFYYTDEECGVPPESTAELAPCLLANLNRVRAGKTLRLQENSLGCWGGRRYLGFAREPRPNLDYFLSCGIPGKVTGERYKKNPSLAKQSLEALAGFAAPKKCIVFQRWDRLTAEEEPEVVVFIAAPDVLAGVFMLAGFAEADNNTVFSPFGSGCSTLVQYPYMESFSSQPRCVLGGFDPSARPHLATCELTLAVPFRKMESMVRDMPDSFLTTPTWYEISRRLPH